MKRLSDVCFVIPIRVDSPERGRNLDLVLDFILHQFDSPILVLEADNERRYFPKYANNKFQHLFVEDNQPVFHRTKYLNSLYEMVNLPIIAVWDTDVILPHRQIIDAAEQIRQGKTVMGLPFDGCAFCTTADLANRYQETMDLNLLEKEKLRLRTMYGKLSVGCAFLVDTEKYKRAGGENEYFFGWGPEDVERVKRIEILFDLPIFRSKGCLYHLWHPRSHNSWYISQQSEIISKQELLKICRMKKKELKQYIDSWPWKIKECIHK